MVNSVDATMAINKFQNVRIPSARDLFYRYGARNSAIGQYSSDGSATAPSVMTNSVIGQIVGAERALANLAPQGVEDK